MPSKAASLPLIVSVDSGVAVSSSTVPRGPGVINDPGSSAD